MIKKTLTKYTLKLDIGKKAETLSLQ